MSHPGITVTMLKPHDLLWIERPEAVIPSAEMPSWASAVLEERPVVVVRRGRSLDGLIPIGIRGRSRNQRFAAAVPIGCIARRVAPEHLVAARREPAPQRDETIPALRAFRQVETAWTDIGRPWGPTGSVGFELATGWPAATQTSDLDLIIRAPSPLSEREGGALLAAVARIDAVADIQVDIDGGCFSLREYCDGRTIRRLVKTCDGPRLRADPWQERGETR